MGCSTSTESVQPQRTSASTAYAAPVDTATTAAMMMSSSSGTCGTWVTAQFSHSMQSEQGFESSSICSTPSPSMMPSPTTEVPGLIIFPEDPTASVPVPEQQHVATTTTTTSATTSTATTAATLPLIAVQRCSIPLPPAPSTQKSPTRSVKSPRERLLLKHARDGEVLHPVPADGIAFGALTANRLSEDPSRDDARPPAYIPECMRRSFLVNFADSKTGQVVTCDQSQPQTEGEDFELLAVRSESTSSLCDEPGPTALSLKSTARRLKARLLDSLHEDEEDEPEDVAATEAIKSWATTSVQVVEKVGTQRRRCDSYVMSRVVNWNGSLVPPQPPSTRRSKSGNTRRKKSDVCKEF